MSQLFSPASAGEVETKANASIGLGRDKQAECLSSSRPLRRASLLKAAGLPIAPAYGPRTNPNVWSIAAPSISSVSFEEAASNGRHERGGSGSTTIRPHFPSHSVLCVGNRQILDCFLFLLRSEFVAWVLRQTTIGRWQSRIVLTADAELMSEIGWQGVSPRPVDKWVTAIVLRAEDYGTHSLH